MPKLWGYLCYICWLIQPFRRNFWGTFFKISDLYNAHSVWIDACYIIFMRIYVILCEIINFIKVFHKFDWSNVGNNSTFENSAWLGHKSAQTTTGLHLSPQLTDYFRITELLNFVRLSICPRNIGDFFALQLHFKAAYEHFYSILLTLPHIISQVIYLKKRLLWTNYIIALTLICHIGQAISIFCVKHVKFCSYTCYLLLFD